MLLSHSYLWFLLVQNGPASVACVVEWIRWMNEMICCWDGCDVRQWCCDTSAGLVCRDKEERRQGYGRLAITAHHLVKSSSRLVSSPPHSLLLLLLLYVTVLTRGSRPTNCVSLAHARYLGPLMALSQLAWMQRELSSAMVVACLSSQLHCSRCFVTR